MTKVRNLANKTQKKSLHYAKPNDTVANVLQRLSDLDLGAMLIIENEQIIGIFSERDYARKLLLKGRSELSTPVKDVMKTNVLYVTPEYSLEECLALMTKKRVKHLPVIENGKLLSVISIEDVAAALIEDQVHHIAELTMYITGSSLYNLSPALPENVRELIWTHKKYSETSVSA